MFIAGDRIGRSHCPWQCVRWPRAAAYLTHDSAHSVTAWCLGWMARPFGIDYGAAILGDVLLLGDVSDNVDSAPIFRADTAGPMRPSHWLGRSWAMARCMAWLPGWHAGGSCVDREACSVSVSLMRLCADVRAVRAHLTAARYVVLAALRASSRGQCSVTSRSLNVVNKRTIAVSRCRWLAEDRIAHDTCYRSVLSLGTRAAARLA